MERNRTHVKSLYYNTHKKLCKSLISLHITQDHLKKQNKRSAGSLEARSKKQRWLRRSSQPMGINFTPAVTAVGETRIDWVTFANAGLQCWC